MNRFHLTDEDKKNLAYLGVWLVALKVTSSILIKVATRNS